MNHYIAFACLLAVVGLGHSNPVGLGYGYGYGLAAAPVVSSVISAPIIHPVSTANMVKAAPIPVIKTSYAPIITAPALVAKPLVSYGYGYGLGYPSLGYPSLGYPSLGLTKGYGLGPSLSTWGSPLALGYGKWH